MPAEITEIVRLEIEKKVKALVPVSGGGGEGMSPEALREQVKGMLPELLTDGQVQSIIISTVAMQAISQPGALGDFSGMRSWLKEEMKRTIQELQQ